METILDKDELAILLEAMEAWVNKDEAGNILGELVSTMFAKDPEKEKVERKGRIEEASIERALRKERAIIIQAKLIQMKDQAIAASLGQ